MSDYFKQCENLTMCSFHPSPRGVERGWKFPVPRSRLWSGIGLQESLPTLEQTVLKVRSEP
jgi:hypothetical protein